MRDDYEALSHIEDRRLRVYGAMVRALDRSVGRVLEALREQGLEENTLVFFTSDNGGAGYVGLPAVNDPFRGWKMSFFEGGIHVPYFLKWPGRIPPGATWLFDMNSDPTEQHNLAEAEPARVEAMKRMLAEWGAEQAAPMWPSQGEGPINIDKSLEEPDAPDDEHIYWPN